METVLCIAALGLSRRGTSRAPNFRAVAPCIWIEEASRRERASHAEARPAGAGNDRWTRKKRWFIIPV